MSKISLSDDRFFILDKKCSDLENVDEGVRNEDCPRDSSAHVREVNGTSWAIPKIFTVFRFGYKPLLIAIDSKFPRNRKRIARKLYKTVEGIKKQVHRARKDEIKLATALQVAAYLPENKDSSLCLLYFCHRIQKRD